MSTERPFIDPDTDSHEGVTDEEHAIALEWHAATCDKHNLRGVAFDLRGAARRLRKISEERRYEPFRGITAGLEPPDMRPVRDETDDDGLPL